MSTVAKRFYLNLMMDVFPSTAAELVDFGLDGDDPMGLYAAYQRAAKTGRATEQDFVMAVGEGKKLTEIVQRVDSGRSVRTSWDQLEQEMKCQS
jgi:hypothetical protein